MLRQPVLEIRTSNRTIRIAAPREPSHYRHEGSWYALDDIGLHALLADATETECTLVLCPRDDVTATSVEAVAALFGSVSASAQFIGWPAVPLNPGTSLQEAVDLRSNDYRYIDAASRIIDAPLSPRDRVSVVIPARNSQQTIEDVVASIAAAAADVTWECIVIDDASDQPLRVRGHGSRVRVVRTDRRLYSGGARNLGLDHARYETVLFCDSDTLLPREFFAHHLPLHRVSPYLVTVSMRDEGDERVDTVFTPEWSGLREVADAIHVRSLVETNNWRDFGSGRRLGPVGLQWTVWSHNICISARAARMVRFPEDYIGWGLEDNAFGAKCIAAGCFIRPVLETPVHHLTHAPRSGSAGQQEREFAANLARFGRDLAAPANAPWPRRES